MSYRKFTHREGCIATVKACAVVKGFSERSRSVGKQGKRVRLVGAISWYDKAKKLYLAIVSRLLFNEHSFAQGARPHRGLHLWCFNRLHAIDALKRQLINVRFNAIDAFKRHPLLTAVPQANLGATPKPL